MEKFTKSDLDAEEFLVLLDFKIILQSEEICGGDGRVEAKMFWSRRSD